MKYLVNVFVIFFIYIYFFLIVQFDKLSFLFERIVLYLWISPVKGQAIDAHSLVNSPISNNVAICKVKGVSVGSGHQRGRPCFSKDFSMPSHTYLRLPFVLQVTSECSSKSFTWHAFCFLFSTASQQRFVCLRDGCDWEVYCSHTNSKVPLTTKWEQCKHTAPLGFQLDDLQPSFWNTLHPASPERSLALTSNWTAFWPTNTRFSKAR